MCFSTASLKSDVKVSLNEIHTLSVKTLSQSIYLYHGGEDLEIKEYLDYSTSPATKEVRGDAYCIDYFLMNWNPFKMMVLEKIELYIPSDFTGQLYLSSASGSIHVEQDWAFENVEIHSTSGKIDIGNLRAEHILIKNTSGGICVANASGDRQFSTVSGCIHIGGGAGATRATSISGGIKINNMCGFAQMKSTSGCIDAGYQELVGNNSFRNTSGHIHIQLPQTAKSVIKTSTTSGSTRFNTMNTMTNSERNHHYMALVGCNNSTDATSSLELSTISGGIAVMN